MANYIARVELHKATYDDYEQLHSSMAARGYARTIGADDGNTYELPTGTYVALNSSATLQTAIDAAKNAAKETGKKYSIIVGNWNAVKMNGLAVAS